MKTSIFSLRAGIVGIALLSLFIAIYIANAAVVINSVTINGGSSATVEPGESVTVDVVATKSGDACENNWGLTRITVDGEVTESWQNSYTGIGELTHQLMFDAPEVGGTYPVLVEIFRGGEEGLDCSNFTDLWESRTLDLTVLAPVKPSITVQNLAPLGETRVVGDTDPLVYTAEVVLAGNPEVPHVECVLFDIFRDDGWQTVPVDFDAVGTYDETDGVTYSYDISGFGVGIYNMVVIALENSCDDLGGFDSSEYIHNGAENAMRTILTITEAVDTLEITNPAVDGENVSGTVDFTAEYVDYDETIDQILWAIRFETCEASTNTVAGNVDGFSDTSDFTDTTFTATLDTTLWADGEYCFVVNPQEQAEEPDLRATRTFVVDNGDDEVEYCDDKAANNYEEEGECTYDEETYLIYGTVWHDENENGESVPEPEETESGISGRTVTIDNGGEGEGYLEYTTETDETGYYEFMVPAGTWTITDGETEDTEQTYPINEGNVHVVTVPELLTMSDTETKGYLATLVDWLIPTAHAVSLEYYSYGSYGPYNFGNVYVEEEVNNDSSSSSSTGTRPGARGALRSAPAGQVLGAATSAPQCGVLLFDFMKVGQDSDKWEVTKLQLFLNGQGFFTPVTGVFDEETDRNVRLFQAAHLSDVLTPWGLTDPTGYVYKTTKWKINNLICPGSEEFPTL